MRLKVFYIAIIFCFFIPFTASLYINIASASVTQNVTENTEKITDTPNTSMPSVSLCPEKTSSTPNQAPSAPLPTPTPCLIINVDDIPVFSEQLPSPPEILRDTEITVKVFEKNLNEVIEMNMHDYIISCVAGEMPATFELEALKAQAIAARTFTLSHMNSSCSSNSAADVCTYHGCCQAYVSVEKMKSNWGTQFNEKYAKIKAAVEGTDSLVMLYNGKPITVFYFSTSNGYTDACQDVFVKTLPYYQCVVSPGEETASGYYSHKKISRSEFIKVLSDKFGIGLLPYELESAISITRTDGGRVDYITFNGIKIRGTKIRTAFGLKSADFHITFDGDNVLFEVYGYGHGVGMSQLGANYMAKQKLTYEYILKHYYIGVDIALISP